MYNGSPARSPDTRLLSNERILEELARNSNPFLTESHDPKLSDETYAFLQKKLTEANALLSAQGDRETNLACTSERLNRENEDLRHQNAAIKSEIQTFRSRQVSLDQQLENEIRQKFAYQEHVDCLEKELKDERERFKMCLERLKDTEGKMIGTDNLAKKMYSLASDSCAQTDALKGEVHSLETLIDTCKSAMTKLSEEKIDLSTKLNVVETEYENYTGACMWCFLMVCLPFEDLLIPKSSLLYPTAKMMSIEHAGSYFKPGEIGDLSPANICWCCFLSIGKEALFSYAVNRVTSSCFKLCLYCNLYLRVDLPRAIFGKMTKSFFFCFLFFFFLKILK